jgi:hypothetical protein
VNVYFIAFGENAASITQDTANSVFFEHARNGPDLLEKITNLCSRIFNYNKLQVNPSTLHIEFDVPMHELIVFAQGQNVNIAGIIDSSGSRLGSSAPVNVKYSTQPALNYPNAPYDTSLNGYIAEFSNKFAPGSYTLSITGADTVEVYYKPDVDIEVFLTDSDGNEVTADTFKPGEYTLNFCFVKSGTKDRLQDSALLGDITYSATIVSNGVKHDGVYTQGDRVALDEGSHRIDATAVYLEYHTVATELVFQSNPLALNAPPDGSPETVYILTEYGFDRDDPFIATVALNGRAFAPEEWDRLSVTGVTGGNGALSFRAEKGDVGEIKVYPVFSGANRQDAESAMGRHSPQLQITAEIGGNLWNAATGLSVRIDSGYRDVIYSPVSVPTYELDKNGIANANDPILVRARLADREITAAEWAMMNELPKVVAESGNIGEFRVEKTDVVGQYALYPTLYQDSVSKTEVVDSGLVFSYTERIGNEVWSGDGTGEGGLRLSMIDTRSWFDRNRDTIIMWAIIGLILLLILGYIPPFKKYLPGSLKPRPTITCTPKRPGGARPGPEKGTYTKKLSSTLIPYKAETGTIRFIPKGVSGAASMSVKAEGGNAMSITNFPQYAGKTNILFNGSYVEKGTNKKTMRPITPGVLIEVKTEAMTYSCQPNT